MINFLFSNVLLTLAVGLAVWLIFDTAHQTIHAVRVMSIVGYPGLLMDPVSSPPGGTYVQRPIPVNSGGGWVERFVVSIPNYILPAFDLELVVPAGLSRSQLDGCPENGFAAIFEDCRPIFGNRCLPESWGRHEKTAILMFLSSVPAHDGRLRCENRRLMLEATRFVDKRSNAAKDPEAFLEGIKESMWQLAETLDNPG